MAGLNRWRIRCQLQAEVHFFGLTNLVGGLICLDERNIYSGLPINSCYRQGDERNKKIILQGHFDKKNSGLLSETHFFSWFYFSNNPNENRAACDCPVFHEGILFGIHYKKDHQQSIYSIVYNIALQQCGSQIHGLRTENNLHYTVFLSAFGSKGLF